MTAGLHLATVEIATILILRKLSQRFRERDVGDEEVPYGPSAPPPDDQTVTDPEEVTVS